MEKLIRRVLQHRRLVIALFLVGALLGGGLSPLVKVGFDMAKYLPPDAPSTVALSVMGTAYQTAVPNLRVMVTDVTIPRALAVKQQIGTLPGVTGILWLDDQADIHIPLETQDRTTVETFYKDNSAIFSVTINEDTKKETLASIREIIGPTGAMSGNSVDIVGAQQTTNHEVLIATLCIFPIILIILLVTSTSWFEPVLFLGNVGVAILLNMGTNLIFGEISFITQACGAILQLACSMDYAIFLLDRFREQRATGQPPQEAMAHAVARSSASILASGLTTVAGFMALMVMRFRIGPDMGYVLAKGIAFSLFTTLVFMPCLTVCCYKLMERTTHRSFMPSFAPMARGAAKIRGAVTLCVVLLLIPCYLGQHRISFLYGAAGLVAPGTQIDLDRKAINARFGESLPFVLLLPVGSAANEQALGEQVLKLPAVTSVMSYAATVGNQIPPEFLPKEQLEQLNSGGYTRMIVNAEAPPESTRTFALVEALRGAAQQYYPDSYHLVGEAVNVYDIKNTIEADAVLVNLIAIGAIAIILLFTFRSVSLPVLLLLTIESSIFINLAIPYFMGTTLNYIGYLVISSIQLGATIDYAILFAGRYYENRRELPAKETYLKTIGDTAGSIFSSAGIMASAGLALGFISTNSVVSQLGILLARGSALSAFLVLVLLPTLLSVAEPLIKRTTRGLTLKEDVV